MSKITAITSPAVIFRAGTPMAPHLAAPSARLPRGSRGRLRCHRLTLLLLLLLLLPLAACGNGSGEGQGQGQGQGQGSPPLPVTVTTLAPEDMAVQVEYPGRLQGSREVEVRARVAGILEKRLYDEGRPVTEGQPLFRIDPEPFAIAEQRAAAERAAARAELEQAERELRRSTTLYQQEAISQRERDQAQTQLQLGQARLQLAEAALADTRRNLRYSEVTAPLAGITGLETISEGNLIEPGTLLTTITRADPIQLHFALPEEDAALLALLAAAPAKAEQEPLKPTIILADGKPYHHSGRIDFTDRVIDPQTGTVRARAIFANPENELLPGQLVRISLQLQQLKAVFALPPAAVANDRNGPLVWLIDENNTVQPRPVQLGPLVAGRRIVLSGLAAGERLVINGQVALAPGMTVNPIAAAAAQEGGE